MKTKTIALLAASAIALAACSGSNDEQQPAGETNVTELNVTSTEIANVSTEAPPAARIDNTAGEVPAPVATLTADEQTMDDADAAGMTAKVDRSGTANETQPAN